jgi:uncharacterized membrane protein
VTIRGGWAWALVIALVLSVGLNLFGAGVAVSLMRVREAASGIVRDVAGLSARFPPELRRGMRRALFVEREALRDDLAALSEARAAMFEAMRAEPFDPAAVAAAMAEVRARTTALQARAQGAALEALREADAGTRALITPPERRGGGLLRRWRERALP